MKRCSVCDGVMSEPDWGPELRHGIEECIASMGERLRAIRGVLEDTEDDSASSVRGRVLEALDARRW